MDELVDVARALIAVPSHEDPGRAGQILVDWLGEHTDAAVERDDVGNVFGRRGPADRPTLALVGHHDVVPPDPSQVDTDGSLRTELADGRLSGRGSADMKGALAAMLCAFRDADPACSLVFASFVGEETGGKGASHAVSAGFAPAYAIVGEGSTGYSEPGSLDVVVAHRGRRAATVIAEGRAAHASEPEAGTNAIYRAIEALERLRALEVPTVDVAGERLVGSLEATRIAGGTTDNVVPDRCEITLDERTLPDRRLPLEETLAGLDGVTVRIDQDWPPMRCSDADFAGAVGTSIREGCGVPAALVTKPHTTDASWLAEAGSATVVVGPAERGEAHTADESVAVDALERAACAYRAIAEGGLPSAD